MVKIYLGIISALTIAFLVALFLYRSECSTNDELRKTVTNLTTSLDTIRTRLAESYEENKQLVKSNEELEKLSEDDKTFNWNADISNSPVVIKLHTN